jgi:hypothetical protein
MANDVAAAGQLTVVARGSNDPDGWRTVCK